MRRHETQLNARNSTSADVNKTPMQVENITAVVRTRQFDVAGYLGSSREVAAYLDVALKEGDEKLLLVALCM